VRDCVNAEPFASEVAAAARRARMATLQAAAAACGLPQEVAADAVQVSPCVVDIGIDFRGCNSGTR